MIESLVREEALAVEILKYSRNELLVSFRFLDLAICKLKYLHGMGMRMGTDGNYLYYEPDEVFAIYKESSALLNHIYFHSLLHCIFYHPFAHGDVDETLWNLACDIAVESIISELSMSQLEVERQEEIANKLESLSQRYGTLTAHRLYDSFLKKGIAPEEMAYLQQLFTFDCHDAWYDTKRQNQEGQPPKDETDQLETLSQWQQISERIKVEMETVSKEWSDKSDQLIKNLEEVHKEHYDYEQFLKKFAVTVEEMIISKDEFDYIFYTYGLELYDNVPLIEPLEYCEDKKVTDFVIAIDTSGSVEGELVKKFMTKTYNILSQQSNFFRKVNVHIIQCDAKVQRDDKITSEEEFDEYISHLTLQGFGGTDFRPVFSYVNELVEQGEFTNLKGMIYFTDGKGVFPENKPPYDTAFVFVDETYDTPQVPVWAMKVCLTKKEIWEG